MSTPSTPETTPAKPSMKAKALASRLRAVQALYQKMQNNSSMRAVVNEYLEFRSEMDVDGEPLVPPDAILFKNILMGVEERMPEIESIVRANLKKDSPNKNVEPLMYAILLCGTYEILIKDVDSPIIINDYLNVGHAFFERNEVALINGVLDTISTLLKN